MSPSISDWALPEDTLLDQQTEWLAPARSKLLRQAHIARRQHILDLGAGYGSASAELGRRTGGSVVALEPQLGALRTGEFGRSRRISGIAEQMPFAANSFDLVYSQLTLLWIADLEQAIHEISRILEPGGAFVGIEPDYAGMIEFPDSIASQDLWLAGLRRAGADPRIGRKLPRLLAKTGFQVRVSLFDALYAPHSARFDFLSDLPLTAEEVTHLEQLQWESSTLTQPWEQVAHLPHMCIYAVLR